MARKKVALELIANKVTRHTTFKKRSKGLMKKANELATLCDIKSCVVVDNNGEEQPEVWPFVVEATHILAHLKAMPELDQCNKKMDQKGFLHECIGKLQEQIHKAERENCKRVTTALLQEALLGHHPGLVDITIEELISLGRMVEMHLHKVMESIHQHRSQKAPAPELVLQSPTDQIQMAATNTAGGNMDYMMREDLMYKALPPHEKSWLDAVRTSGGDLGTVVYRGFAGSNYNCVSHLSLLPCKEELAPSLRFMVASYVQALVVSLC